MVVVVAVMMLIVVDFDSDSDSDYDHMVLNPMMMNDIDRNVPNSVAVILYDFVIMLG